MRILLVTLVAVLSVLTGTSLAQEVPVLSPADIPHGSIVSTEYYSGNALFGYIDGGAELYLEYGFLKLGRQEVTAAGEKIIVEVYRMGSALEAYGILSVQRFKCVPVDAQSPYTCLSKYQLQAVLGRCYLSIINESGSAAARNESVSMFKTIRAKVESEPMEFPSVFESPELKPYRAQLVTAFGYLGVQNGCADLDSLFQNFPRFTLTVLPIEAGNEHMTIAHLHSSSEKESSEFCSKAGFGDVPPGEERTSESGGIMRSIHRLSSEVVIYSEATSSFPNRDALSKLLSGQK